MSARQVLRFAAMVLTALVLLTAGLYVIVYLYRWEWNRAIIAGLFFLAALVTFSTVLILRRLRGLEERLNDIERTRRLARTVVAEENDERAARHFEWLRRPPDRLEVFIPVLLGAGVLLSFVAYFMERVAGMIAGPTVDRRTARLLELDLPLGTEDAGAELRRDTSPESVWRPRIRVAESDFRNLTGTACAVWRTDPAAALAGARVARRVASRTARERRPVLRRSGTDPLAPRPWL